MMAQENEKTVIYQEYSLGEYAPVSISYYGNFVTHPGVKVGFDWNLFLVEKTKQKKTTTRTIRNLYLISPSVAFYSQKGSHLGLVVMADFAWRHYTKKLFFTETSLGLGYFRKFNSGETWVENEDGSVSNIGNTSRGYFTPSVSFAFGKQFRLKSDQSIEVFTKVNTNLLMDYNTSVVPEFSLELGARMAMNWGVKRGDVKKKIK